MLLRIGPTVLVLAALLAPTAAAAAPSADTGTPSVQACGAAPADMACIPGGPFVRGRDDGPANEGPRAQVWLQTYFMDIDEVTFSAYQACVRQRKCRPKRPIYSDFNRPKQPMVALTWFDAVAFCKAKGKHLPSEAEWEKAARGPDGDLNPWGNEPTTCERAIVSDDRGRSCGVKKKGLARLADVGRTFEVGSRPAYRYGLRDMVGNSWEWTADWFDGDFARCGADCLGADPKGPCKGATPCRGRTEKVLRGGSWYWDASYATGTYRRPYVPENEPTSHFGFRCAASVGEALKASGSAPGRP